MCMPNLPSVAAIIPTFNRKDKLCRFLDLMLIQTYPNLQIIVIDSSSRDGTTKLVMELFPQITLIQVSDREFWTGARRTKALTGSRASATSIRV